MKPPLTTEYTKVVTTTYSVAERVTAVSNVLFCVGINSLLNGNVGSADSFVAQR